MTWTDELFDALKRHWNHGFSCSQIANELHREYRVQFSRNAVIGKVHRAGLDKDAPRRPVGNPKPKPRGPRRIRRNRNNGFDVVPTFKPEPLRELPMTDDLSIPQEQRKQLLELENRHCRWPVGNPGTPDFFFCGHPSADMNMSRPYCRKHARDAGRKYDYAHTSGSRAHA